MGVIVDVFSDVICPWCFIGKRRLEKAVAAGGASEVQVRWLPFQLNPTMPQEGIEPREYRTNEVRKLGAVAGTRRPGGRGGRGEGIALRLRPDRADAEHARRPPAHLAGRRGRRAGCGRGGAVPGYFTEGRDICDPQTLLDVVAEAGLDRGRAERFWRVTTDWRKSRRRKSGLDILACRGFRSSSSVASSPSPCPGTAGVPRRFRPAGTQSPSGDGDSVCRVGIGGTRPVDAGDGTEGGRGGESLTLEWKFNAAVDTLGGASTGTR